MKLLAKSPTQMRREAEARGKPKRRLPNRGRSTRPSARFSTARTGLRTSAPARPRARKAE